MAQCWTYLTLQPPHGQEIFFVTPVYGLMWPQLWLSQETCSLWEWRVYVGQNWREHTPSMCHHLRFSWCLYGLFGVSIMPCFKAFTLRIDVDFLQGFSQGWLISSEACITKSRGEKTSSRTSLVHLVFWEQLFPSSVDLIRGRPNVILKHHHYSVQWLNTRSSFGHHQLIMFIPLVYLTNPGNTFGGTNSNPSDSTFCSNEKTWNLSRQIWGQHQMNSISIYTCSCFPWIYKGSNHGCPFFLI